MPLERGPSSSFFLETMKKLKRCKRLRVFPRFYGEKPVGYYSHDVLHQSVYFSA